MSKPAVQGHKQPWVKRIRRFTFDILVITSIAVLILFGMEMGLRWIFPEKIPAKKIPVKTRFIAYEYNEHYLVALKPGIEKTYTRSPSNGSKSIAWRTNQNGFRGEELHENPDLRIMVYGDSNIQARFSILENTFCHKLEALLNKTLDGDVEVINAGTIGHGPDQYLLRFKQEAELYQPDLVLFHIFTDNDYGDIIRNRLFELDEKGQLARSSHLWTWNIDNADPSPIRLFFRSLLLTKALKKVLNSLKNNMATEQKYIDGWKYAAKEEFTTYTLDEPLLQSPFKSFYDIDVAIAPQSDSAREKIQLATEILQEAQAFASSKGMGFMVQLQPSVVDLTKNSKWANFEYLAEHYPQYKKTNLTKPLEEFCRVKEIPCLNLFDTFESNSPENLYFVDNDDHWNDAGQDLAASVCASFMEQEFRQMFEEKDEQNPDKDVNQSSD